MTKNIMNISLSILFLTFAVAICFAMFSFKEASNEYFFYLGQKKQAQEEILKKGTELQEIITEAGIALGVAALSEENIIPPTEAEKMITESLEKIGKKSERLGQIAKYINDYRIMKLRRRR